MKFKTGDLVLVKNVGVDHLKQYNNMCGEIISWIKTNSEIKYKVRIYKLDGWETAYFKENELELLDMISEN
ncbi:hypothetical protein G8S49_05540 [Clostridium botulinum C]|uniref:Uncharacterized protein n=2 Tax=Clostridium botulinum TaxID=1491 RepID=A0A9Q4XVA0_CLOBO|nr:hypothetical protein [Clostridium botulinum]YP_398480.1 hypothetical protein CST050 [Clostridium phage c-st]MCD3194905.1 hypothetical protein [Clostridium botulinum C]MCD3200160.1 hypothetical protein [Clostridium botulinum C]MCD3205773.1 hypothetical protein [Clostridium botulinum C]MCD3207392.1 hypothetical protein [Clostridium botulinum C]MCD3226126.1 hypothetical protein [Clostridium botulinum C]